MNTAPRAVYWHTAPSVGSSAILEAALGEIVRHFSCQPGAASAQLWTGIEMHDARESAWLFAIPATACGQIHIVGSGALAENLRGLLRAGAVAGWSLRALPSTPTPLLAVQGPLGRRCYQLLTRHGFTSVDELAATPDAGLLDLRGIGPTAVATIRAITTPTC